LDLTNNNQPGAEYFVIDGADGTAAERFFGFARLGPVRPVRLAGDLQDDRPIDNPVLPSW
jgi:hypothetical protein